MKDGGNDRKQKDTQSVWLQIAEVECSNINGFLCIEFESEICIIVLNITSLLLKCLFA